VGAGAIEVEQQPLAVGRQRPVAIQARGRARVPCPTKPVMVSYARIAGWNGGRTTAFTTMPIAAPRTGADRRQDCTADRSRRGCGGGSHLMVAPHASSAAIKILSGCTAT
jgi:hypothetical protein